MKRSRGRWVASASDLRRLAGCVHAVVLDRMAAKRDLERPRLEDPMLEMLARFGLEHEAAYVERLRGQGLRVVAIDPGRAEDELEEAERATERAMADGADVVFQATFYRPPWRGHADFLLRVEHPSDFGAWSYEPADTKLHAKATADDWLQLAFYARELARLQGTVPALLHVITPKDTQSTEASEHLARLDELSARLLSILEDPPLTEPDPVSMCARCEWIGRCKARWAEVDHLSLAGVDVRQRPKLRNVGIDTVTALADLPDATEVPGITWPVLQRLRSDAKLVLHERRTNEPHVRLRYPREGKGLSALPEPHPGDIYIDLEGFQFAEDGQLEYLFGVHRPSDAPGDTFRAFWSHDRPAEKVAFEAAVDVLTNATVSDPTIHVYHYNSYEPAAFRRLAERYDTRRQEVRALLSGAMVDLLPIARYSVRTSSLSASLKSLEVFYRTGRSGEVTHAAGSMVAYDKWRRTRDPRILRGIEDYNRDDCKSLAELHQWLDTLATDTRRAGQKGAVDDEDAIFENLDSVERAVVAIGRARNPGDPAWTTVRRALLAVEFSLGELPSQLSEATGVPREDLSAQLILGKKELGIPIAVSDLRASRSD